MKIKQLSRLIAAFFLFAAAPYGNGTAHEAEAAGNSNRAAANAPTECDETCYDMFAGYLVFIRKDPRAGGLRVLEIRKSGATVFEGPPGIWNLLDDVSEPTGDDRKTLAASYYSFGAHCCTTFYLFELGTRFSVVVSSAMTAASLSRTSSSISSN